MRFANLACVPLLIVFIYSCKKVEVAGAQGPQGPDGPAGSSATLSGAITGKVVLYDLSGTPLADNSGANIQLDNTDPIVSGSSNASGIFTISNATAGSYNLTVSKQGYGSMRVFNFLHPGGVNPSQTGTIDIDQQIGADLDIKKLYVDTSSYAQYSSLTFKIILEHPQKISNSVVIYINHQPGITKEISDFNFRSNFFQETDSSLIVGPFASLSLQALDKFQTTDNVYFAAAVDNPHLSFYTDEIGNVVYPAVGNFSDEVKIRNIFKR